MRPRISIRGSVRPSVRRSVRPSVGPLRLFKNRENRSNKAWETFLFATEDHYCLPSDASLDTTPATASHTATSATTGQPLLDPPLDSGC